MLIGFIGDSVSGVTKRLFEFPDLYAALDADRTSRGALVLPHPSRTGEVNDALFFENVCRNRGWNVRTFPGREEALAWLRDEAGDDAPVLLGITGGNPLRAVRSIDEEYLGQRKEIAGILASRDYSIDTAGQLTAGDPDRVLEILYQLLSDSIARTMTGEERAGSLDVKDEITAMSGESLDSRYAMLDRVTHARGLVAGTANPNAQMLFEWVLLGESDAGGIRSL